jgi:hypothetical protein
MEHRTSLDIEDGSACAQTQILWTHHGNAFVLLEPNIVISLLMIFSSEIFQNGLITHRANTKYGPGRLVLRVADADGIVLDETIVGSRLVALLS